MHDHASTAGLSDNDREVARFVRQVPRPRLVRVLGAPGSGRTSLALDLVAAESGLAERSVVVVDSLGHGLPTLRASQPRFEMLHVPGTDLEVAFASARKLVATGSVSAVVIDDLLGLDTPARATGAEHLQRVRLLQRALRILSSACLARGVLLVVLDRVSPMGIMGTPLGFVDILAAPSAEASLAA